MRYSGDSPFRRSNRYSHDSREQGLWASRFVETLLFGLTPRDVPTLTAAAALLAAIGLLAAWLPARRAVRLDPARVLHEV
jgi:ABC-type lipoprotein release transport system permease subunit